MGSEGRGESDSYKVGEVNCSRRLSQRRKCICSLIWLVMVVSAGYPPQQGGYYQQGPPVQPPPVYQQQAPRRGGGGFLEGWYVDNDSVDGFPGKNCDCWEVCYRQCMCKSCICSTELAFSGVSIQSDYILFWMDTCKLLTSLFRIYSHESKHFWFSLVRICAEMSHKDSWKFSNFGENFWRACLAR